MRTHNPVCEGRRSRPLCGYWPAVALLLLGTASVARAGPRWKLIYYRQIGNYLNANSHVLESHLFRENGSKGAGVGVTNLSNQGSAIFGYADPDGWNRVTMIEPHMAYDVRIFDPSSATDQSPNFYFRNPSNGRWYSFETQWMWVSDEGSVTAFPQTPVYHYDLVSGLNSSTLQEPAGTDSDAYAIQSWADYQAQTFVVPPGINRIVSAQAFVVRQANTHFQYRASIRQGGPTGPQVGPAVTSRCVVSVEFLPVLVNWGIDDVPVTPGQTYALRLEAFNNPVCEESPQTGFNAYATQANNYANGTYYDGPTARPDRDLLAIVVGVNYAPRPRIEVSPVSFTRSVVQTNNLPNDSFTVRNAGAGTLQYSITKNASWIQQVSPSSGTSTGENDTIQITYATASLSPGSYSAEIAITDNNASNSPLTIPVDLTVLAAPTIVRTPSALSVTTRQGTNPAPATFTIRNGGGGTLTYSISDNRDWMSCNPTNGSSLGESDTINVVFNAASLPPGIHQGAITIAAAGALNTPQAIDVTVEVKAAADFDDDGDVDLGDFSFFQSCFNGPNRPPTIQTCTLSDIDKDADVDLTDFATFQTCFNGPNRPPACGT